MPCRGGLGQCSYANVRNSGVERLVTGLQLAGRRRELALFNLAIDSKLRACDLVKLRVRDVCHGAILASRAIVQQQKTLRPVRFEITEPTRETVGAWIAEGQADAGGSAVPKSGPRIRPPVDPAVRTDRGLLGRPAWSRRRQLRDARSDGPRQR
jgi:hypothetical protein